MKKSILFIALFFSFFVLASCGVSQQKYDDLLRHNTKLESDNSKLQKEYDALKKEYDELKEQSESLLETTEKLYSAYKELEASSAQNVAKSVSRDDGLSIYEDEYITIKYLGTEKESHFGGSMIENYLVFYVFNNTDTVLEVRGETFAIDGESIGRTSGIEDIPAKCGGKVKFSPYEDSPFNLSPSTLSGEIVISSDLTSSLYNEKSKYHSIVFSNIDVSPILE